MASHQVLTLAGSGGCHKDPTRTFAGVPGARRPGAGAHPAGAGLWPPRHKKEDTRAKNTTKAKKHKTPKQTRNTHTHTHKMWVFSFLGEMGVILFPRIPANNTSFSCWFPITLPPPTPPQQKTSSLKTRRTQRAMDAPSIANKYRGFLVRLLAIYFLGVNYTTWFPMPTTYSFRFGEIFGRDKDYSPQMCGQCIQSKEPVFCFFSGPRYLRTTHWPTSHATCLSCIFRYHFGSF